MKATVSEKGQVTIPKPIRKRLGIRAGHVLDIREERGRLIATKVVAEDPVTALYGILKARRTTGAVLMALRGKVDRT